jgi:hypothetical protein
MDISTAGRAQWQPFFDAWGRYAHALPSVTGKNYVDALYVFLKKYPSGELIQRRQDGKSKLQGVVIVVASDTKTTSSVADFIAEQLGGAQRFEDMDKLTKAFMEDACEPGQGQILSVTAEQGVGKVRKLVQSYGKEMALILFNISSIETATKKLQGLVNAWRQTRCQRLVVELPYDSLFRTDQTLQPNEPFQSMLAALSTEPTTESDDTKSSGLLIFFPGIPGCGKSCMVGSEESIRALLEEKERNLLVVAGDKTTGKYWPLVKQLTKQEKTSSVVLADKNSPSSAWEIIAGVCEATRSVGVPVLPDEGALVTTEIRGIQQLDGTVDEHNQHVYPFSLAYLAVCMTRVLVRPPGTHAGKLDSGTKRACLIVTKFYSMYRRIAADELLNTVQEKFGREGALLASSPIKLPFFKSPEAAGDLPTEVKDIMVEALKVQVSERRT